MPVRESTFTFQSEDHMEIFTFKWQANKKEQNPPRAIIQIAHGSVEHAERYKFFAEELTRNGFIVYANDHRGHGKTAKTIDNLSYFSDMENGWNLAVRDLHTLTGIAQKEHPDLPIFLFGHSMGSFLLRDYMSQYGTEIQGAILSGTAGGMIGPVKALKLLSKQLIKLNGKKTKSPFLHSLIYGSLNKKIKDRKTDFDFLSRDETEVQKYIDDPFCGNTVTTEYAYQMASGLEYISRPSCFKKVPKTLPVYIFSGGKDPVGGKNGKDIVNIYNTYKKYGINDVSLKIYQDARHETINETNREEVYKDVIMWMNSRLL